MSICFFVSAEFDEEDGDEEEADETRGLHRPPAPFAHPEQRHFHGGYLPVGHPLPTPSIQPGRQLRPPPSRMMNQPPFQQPNFTLANRASSCQQRRGNSYQPAPYCCDDPEAGIGYSEQDEPMVSVSDLSLRTVYNVLILVKLLAL